MPTPITQAIVELRDLSIGYASRQGRTIVAQGIDARMEKGELTCLLGPNGTGKSTLLRTLAGFQPPLSGRILLKGKAIGEYKPMELARMVGVVLTEKPDVQNTTALEMALMGRTPYTGFFGIPSALDRSLAMEALRMVGVDGLSARSVATLSDGERQKVMIAKALAQHTPLILLDEPTAFLDFPSKTDLMRTLRRVCHEAGRCALVSTHDVAQAIDVADRIWLMAGGDYKEKEWGFSADGLSRRCLMIGK